MIELLGGYSQIIRVNISFYQDLQFCTLAGWADLPKVQYRHRIHAHMFIFVMSSSHIDVTCSIFSIHSTLYSYLIVSICYYNL